MKAKFALIVIGVAVLFTSFSTGIDAVKHSPVIAMDLGATPAADPQNSIMEAWSNFYYVFAAGTAFTTRTSSPTWTYGGFGCVYSSSASELLNLTLDLPEGARIDYLRLYYYDTNANNSTAWITTYNNAGGVTDLLAVSSTGNAGYGYWISPFLGHVVDNASNSYVLNWRPNATGTTMQLCGMRVAYRMPLNETVFLPMVIR